MSEPTAVSRIGFAAGVTAAAFNLALYLTGTTDFFVLLIGCVCLFAGLVMR